MCMCVYTWSCAAHRDGESAQQYAVRVFNRLYKDDIERLQGMTVRVCITCALWYLQLDTIADGRTGLMAA